MYTLTMRPIRKSDAKWLVAFLPDALLSISLIALSAAIMLAVHGPLGNWADYTLREWGSEAQFPQITRFSFSAVRLLQSWVSLGIVASLVVTALILQITRKQRLLLSLLLIVEIVFFVRLSWGVFVLTAAS
jgi:hypothetical protein